VQLNFDKFNFQIKTENNKNYIWDKVRKKHVALTPEEWVRQHCLHQLVANGFGIGLLSVERSLPNSKKRYDIVYLSTLGTPKLLVECKAPSIPINEKTLDQVASYLSLLDVSYALLTNGLQHFFISRVNKEIKIVQEFPTISKISD
jgi:hypothetical protein